MTSELGECCSSKVCVPSKTIIDSHCYTFIYIEIWFHLPEHLLGFVWCIIVYIPSFMARPDLLRVVSWTWLPIEKEMCQYQTHHSEGGSFDNMNSRTYPISLPETKYSILVALHSMLLVKHFSNIWDLNGQFWSSKGHLMKSPFWHYQSITDMHIAAKPKLHTTLKLFDALLFKNFFYHFALKDGSWWSSNVMRISATKEFSPWG